MKVWKAPELAELDAKWTRETLFAAGSDSHGESVMLNGESVPIGSGCCCC